MPAATLRFGPFTLDGRAYRLVRDAESIALSPRALDLLFLLADRAGALVTKATILETLWPGVTVTENALTQVVSELRRVLGDSPSSPRYIETVPRRGFRFVAAVDREAPDASPPDVARRPAPETASLEAYRAATEGRLKLEALDPALVDGAEADFQRAIALDPGYAVAHVGLAHARFWRFEAARAGGRLDRNALASAIAGARTATELDPELAEGHAALALFLAAADRPREAVAAGRRAVALEPASWKHQFRLGVAAWGDERLRCLETAQRLFPPFAWAYYGAAMVHVARSHFREAEDVLAAGLAAPTAERRDVRFPGAGLHWLAGLLRLAAGDLAAAEAAFTRELGMLEHALHARVFAADALDGLACARLANGDSAGAAVLFERALAQVPDRARSLAGLAQARRRAGDRTGADEALGRARRAVAALDRDDRRTDAALATACVHVVEDRVEDAVAALGGLLAAAPPGSAGWMMPVDPLLAGLRTAPGWAELRARLAGRAR